MLDVDGTLIDPAAIISAAATNSSINPQALLTTMEKEQSAVSSTVRLLDHGLRYIMGYDPKDGVLPRDNKSVREQIADAAAQFRRDLDRLANGAPTGPPGSPAARYVGITKASDDPLDVTPASKVVAVLFTYTNWVGQGWGGRLGIGGNFLFCHVWGDFVEGSGFPKLTYTGHRIVGTGTADLSITTDGTIGVLAPQNIIDWRITVTNGGDTFTLLGPLSGNNSG